MRFLAQFLIIMPLVGVLSSGQAQASFEGFSRAEQEFVVAYKGYVQALIHGQAAETKKRLACLGFRQSDVLNPSGDENLEQLISQYSDSDECQSFLSEGVQRLFTDYSQMRVYLALHQARTGEVVQMMSSTNSFGGLSQGPLLCDRVENPLGFRNTQFCFSQIETLLNPQPEHLIKKTSYAWLDRLLEREDTPQVVGLAPLIWEEVLMGAQLFDQHYRQSGAMGEQSALELLNDYDQQVLDSLSPWQLSFADQILSYQRQVRMSGARIQQYFQAVDFQAPGAYVFSDYPEGSAPARYVELLAKNPVLAFFEPPMVERELLCDDSRWQSLGVSQLCQTYKQSLRTGFLRSSELPTLQFSQDFAQVKQALIAAYLKVLRTNQLLLDELENDESAATTFLYDYSDEGEIEVRLSDLTSEQVGNWQHYLSMDGAMDQFLQSYPEYEEIAIRLQDQASRRELIRLAGMMGAAVAISLPCGFFGPQAYVACLLLTGLSANGLFYLDSLSRHDLMMRRFLSSGFHEDEESVSLVHFASYKSEVQALYIDSLFMWVGIGIVPTTRTTYQTLRRQLSHQLELRRGQ